MNQKVRSLLYTIFHSSLFTYELPIVTWLKNTTQAPALLFDRLDHDGTSH